MSNLKEILKEFYNGKIEESELELASNNLINLFELFYKIEQRKTSNLDLEEDDNN